jgi:hypothetical protein
MMSPRCWTRVCAAWSIDVVLVGHTPESRQSLSAAPGEQKFAAQQAAGEAATWQELHDAVQGTASNAGP